MKKVVSFLSLATVLALLIGTFALPAGAAVNTAGFAAQVVALCNEERAEVNVAALQFGNKALNDAAMQRAKEYAANPSLKHNRPGNKSYSTVLAEFGVAYSSCGENIAEGYTSPESVVRGWMTSEGHMKNIMGVNSDFNWIGVAVCEGANGRLFWVQLFVKGTLINDGDINPNGGTLGLSSEAPAITGPTSMNLTVGYAATYTGSYTITGTSPITITKISDPAITWDHTNKRLKIAAGLAAGTYPVTLTASNGTAPDATLTFTLTVSAAPHTHSFGSTWAKDAANHWHACACGEKSALAAHTSGEWIIDVAPTALAAGSQHKECTVCKYVTVTEAIPATGGNYLPGTTIEASPLNWILYTVLFGWIWMRFI